MAVQKRTTFTYLIQNERVQTFAALALLFSLFAAYVYCVSASVVHVVIRKEINTEIAQLNSDISTLESKYIARQHAVSREIARREGFVSATNKVFLDRTDTSLAANQVR